MKQMKDRILLEQLIRKALHEQGATIVVETAVLNTEEDKLMDDLHKEILGITQQTQVTYSTADGTAILISRRGGRGDDKKFEISTEDLKKQAIFKLNTLQAGLLAKTSSDYVWVLDMQDTKLDKRKKSKEERLFATYRFPAFYISRSLIAKSITASTTGYIGTIGKGAMLFDRAKIKDTEWKYTGKTGERIDKPDQIVGVLTVPRSTLMFGDTNSSVLKLYKYFYSDETASSQLTNATTVKDSIKFGCELRAACEQFQKEQRLAVTGEWDSASIAKAEALYQAKVNKLDPDQTPPASYIFVTPADLKTRIATCEIETKPKVEPTAAIKYELDKTKDSADLLKVQQQMITWLETNGISNAPKTSNPYKTYKKLKDAISGKSVSSYGPITKSVVALIKGILVNQLNKTIDSDATYIDEKFIDLIK